MARTKFVEVNFLPIFTIKDLKALNPEVIDITIRYKIQKAESIGKIKKVGKVIIKVGRPENVYISEPLTEEISEELRKMKVILD